MNYDTMEAGRELDALVAERVMGWKNVRCLEGGNIPYGEPDDDWNRDVDEHRKHGSCGFPMEHHREEIPQYSKDISAAWEVLEKFSGYGAPQLFQRDDGGWEVNFRVAGDQCFIASNAPTAPLAICRAALKAVEET